MMKNTITIGATISAIMSTTMAEDPASPLTCVASDFSKELIEASVKFTTTDADLVQCQKDIVNIDIPFDVIAMIEIDDDGTIIIPEDVEETLKTFLTDSNNVKIFCKSTSCLNSLTAFELALKNENVEIPDCTIGILNPSTVIDLVQYTCATLVQEVEECVASDFSKGLIEASVAFTKDNTVLDQCQEDIVNDIPFDVIANITIDGDKIVIPEDVEETLKAFLTDSNNVNNFCESTSCLDSLTDFELALKNENVEIPDCTIGILNPSTVIDFVRSICASLVGPEPEETTAPYMEPPTYTGEEPETCVLQDFEDLIEPGKEFLVENAEILVKCQESLDLDGLANPLDAITSVQLGEDGEINFPDEVVQQLTTFVIENTDAFCGSEFCSGALVLLYDAVKDLEIPDCLINDLVNPSTIIEEVQKTCKGDYNVATDFNLGTKDASKDTTDASAASSIQQVSLLLSAVVISLALML